MKELYIDIGNLKNEIEEIKSGDIVYISGNIYTARADNPVDACVAMIEKLHKLNLL